MHHPAQYRSVRWFAWLWAVSSLLVAWLFGRVSGWTLLHTHPALFWAAMAFVAASAAFAPVVFVIGIAGVRAGKITVSAFMSHFVAPLCLLILGITIAAFYERRRSQTPNKPAAPNAGIASRLTIGHHWTGVGEPGRSARGRRP